METPIALLFPHDEIFSCEGIHAYCRSVLIKIVLGDRDRADSCQGNTNLIEPLG